MLLETQGLSKSFHGIAALQDVSLSLAAGEVHGLVGENGAGKSTLIKLLTGVYRPDRGAMLWDGQPMQAASPQESQRLGIHAVHQDRTLIPTFSCVENAYLGTPYPTRGGRIDWKAMERRVQETAARIGVTLDLRKTAAELSPPQRTELELVRANLSACRLLILDEPTASLTDREAERLFAVIQALREAGTAILYVTHRLDEIFRLTDRVSVLRNGQLVSTQPTASVTQARLVAAMAGCDAPPSAAGRSGHTGPALLEVKDLSSRDGAVRSASLTVHAGEILGLFGLGGSGRTELLECLYGLRPRSGGEVLLSGRPQKSQPTPADSLRQGVALIPEDRRGKALVGGLSVRDNMLLSALDRCARGGIRSRRAEQQAAAEQAAALQIKAVSLNQPISELSGGNQQKAVFARVLLMQPQVLLCDEPTQAVDVGTRAQLHRLLREKADQGCGVLYVSSDLSELLEVADRVQVLSRGRTLAPLPNDGLTARQVLALCYES